MFSDVLFRLVNTAGGLALDDSLWRRQVLGHKPPVRRRVAEVPSRRDGGGATRPAR